MRIVSGGHVVWIVKVSLTTFISVLTPLFTKTIEVSPLATKVSLTVFISVTITVSSFTVSFWTMVGSFAIARFR